MSKTRYCPKAYATHKNGAADEGSMSFSRSLQKSAYLGAGLHGASLASAVGRAEVLVPCPLGAARVRAATAPAVRDAVLGVALRTLGAAGRLWTQGEGKGG